MQRTNRYPGVRPFETEDKDLFFGRDTDVADLGDLIALEQLVVLFGKSGYGKSSLLNAGIIPHLSILRDADDGLLLPIMVRFGSYVENTSPTPIDNLLTRINEKVVVHVTEESQFLEDLLPEQPLWYQFKRRQTAEKRRFLLVFDQFEEFFTYPSSQQNAFKVQLAELLYQDTPQSIREVSPTLSREQRQFLSQIIEVKVLFAIRADRMSFLDSMKEKLPAILQVRYELKGLSEIQAWQAIEQPAKSEGSYLSTAFTYSPESLQIITQRLSESKNSQRLGIEAFQLQILCEYLETKIIQGDIPNNYIEPAHFADHIDLIYEGYYQRLLNKLPKQSAHAAQRLIEESLIFSDEKTGESRRLSMDADVLVQRYHTEGITHNMLRELENTFLLRREVNSVGGISYEISHDSMILPIINSKIKRESIEISFIKKKKLRYLYLCTILLSIIIIPVAYLFNDSHGRWGGGEQYLELTMKGVPITNDSIMKKTIEFLESKYSKTLCNKKPVISYFVANDNLRVSITGLKGEIITDVEAPILCKLIKMNNEQCACIKKERIDFEFNFSSSNKNTIIRIRMDAKYASGFYENVKNSSYIDMEADFSDYFQDYTSKLRSEYSH